MKTEIQEALHQFLIEHLHGKEYEEKMRAISELEEYLLGIKDALRANNTPVHCEHCKNDSMASKWTTTKEDKSYEKNVNTDSNDYDEWITIHSVFTYGICPICGSKKFLNEEIKHKTPVHSFF